MSRSLISALVVALVSLPRFAIAQGTTATISGRITDTTGAIITNAKVQATNILNGSDNVTTTNPSGVYVLPNLSPGEYRVVVDKEGFRQIVLTGLTLNLQDSISRNFTMQIGSVIQSVTLTADGPMMDISPSVSTVVNDQFVQNMPLNGRSFQSLMALTPGFEYFPTAIGYAGGQAPGQFVVNGQRSDANYFTVDGVSANFGSTPFDDDLGQSLGGAIPAFDISGGTNSLLSVDAMQEFRIQTSSFDAEYGRSPGAQISIVTKSGTNQFHGTAFDYLRNDYFDARNYFDAPPLPQPPLRQNDFGGTLGGPVPRTNTFFFFSYEGLRLRLPQTSTADIYTLAARQAVAPAFQPILNALPIPNGPVDSDGITAPLTAAYSDPTSLNAYSLRLDHSIGQRIKLFARYSHAPSTQSTRQFNFSPVSVSTADSDSVTAGATISISPTKMNDFRANWSRQVDNNYSYLDNFGGAIPPPDSALFPPAYNSKSSHFVFVADNNEIDTGQGGFLTQRQWNLVDTFSVTSGTHQLKFGFDFRRLTPTDGQENYTDLIIGSYPQLQNGIASDITTFANSTIAVAMNNFSLFAQDTWRASPRLTLSYGLRWEINTPPVSTTPGSPLYAVNGIFNSQPFGLAPAGTPLWHTGYTNFAPRMGAAFQLSPSTMLRGGFGLFYDLGYGGGVSGTISNFPYNRQGAGTSDTPFNLSNPAFQPPPFTLVPGPGTPYISAIDPNLRLPLTYQWNVALERAFGANQSLSATYVGSFGDQLLREDTVQEPVKACCLLVFSTHNAGWSHYNAVQLQYQRRMSRGLQALVSYSFAKSMDTESTDVGGGAYVPQLSYASPAYDYGPSDFDVRHTFSAALSYQVPNTDVGGRIGRALMRGWAVDSIVRWNSALPFTVYAYAPSPIPQLTYVRPNIVPGQPFYVPYNQPGGRILNINAFSYPTDAPGDLPRNYFRGFPISQTDLAVSRRFIVTERLNFYLRAEYFNVFNHPMFGPPEFPYIYLGSGMGQITQTLNESLGGQNVLYSIGGPRSGQLTIKLQF
jgi:hypothetical protein